MSMNPPNPGKTEEETHMKKILCLAMALMMVLGMVSFASADDTITLRFSWWGGDARHEATLAVIEQFEALHPNIHIEAEYGSSDGYHDKLSTQLAGGTAPDIIQIDPETLPTYVAANKGYFADLEALGFQVDKFDEAFLRQRINGYYDGVQIGIPTGIAGAALVVNQQTAEKFGIDLTQEYTWDDLIEMGKKVHEADPEYYLLSVNMSCLTNMVFLSYAKQLVGDSLFNTETRTLNITEEQMAEVFSYIKALYDNNVVPPASNMTAYENDNLQADPNWIAGKYVCAFGYVSTFTVLTAAAPDYTFYAGKLPVMTDAKNGGWAANCPQVIVVNGKSEHAAEAVEFLNYFFNDPTAMETLGTTRSIPPTSEACEVCAAAGKLDPVLSDCATIAASYGGVVNDSLISAAESKQIIFDTIEQVAFGMYTPEQAASECYAYLAAYAE